MIVITIVLFKLLYYIHMYWLIQYAYTKVKGRAVKHFKQFVKGVKFECSVFMGKFDIWHLKKYENLGKEPSYISANNHILLHISFVASLYFLMISTLYKCTHRCIHIWCTSLWKYWLKASHVPEGLNLRQKVSTYHNYGQCCVINLYRFHFCKIEPVNRIISPDHVIVTELFCDARK